MVKLVGIIKILDEKGPLPIFTLYSEAGNLMSGKERPFGAEEMESVLTRKKDLFLISNEMISILPDKQLCYLTVYSEQPGNPAYQIRVDFSKGRFILMEWIDRGVRAAAGWLPAKALGDIGMFKARLYCLGIWNWEKNYTVGEGIILDGRSWSVKLQTKTAIYESSGVNEFPEMWPELCKAIEELTGSPFR